MTPTAVTVEFERNGRTRRVGVCLSPLVDSPLRGQLVRAMAICSDDGSTARLDVATDITWDAVLAHIELLLRFEDRNREAVA